MIEIVRPTASPHTYYATLILQGRITYCTPSICPSICLSGLVAQERKDKCGRTGCMDRLLRLSLLRFCWSYVVDGLMRRLQAVQNAAARLQTGTRRRDHITPVLRQLHWLPVRQRVNFKLVVLVFKALHNLAPCYLVDDCQLETDAGRRRLRSSDAATCVTNFIVPAPALAIRRLEFPYHLYGTVSPLNSANLISLLDSSADR